MKKELTPKEKRLKVYKTILKVITSKRPKYNLDYGFCSILTDLYFDGKIESHFIEDYPELMKHRPKKMFYTWENIETTDKTMFWFKIGQWEKRIEIMNKVVNNFKID